MPVPFVFREEMTRYDFGRGHPFRAANVGDLRRLLEPHMVDGRLVEVGPEIADDGLLATVHDRAYIARVIDLEGTEGHLSPDTWVAQGTPAAARAVVGGAARAVDLALDGDRVVLCPGGFHHAGRDYGEGFCIFNDVAIAATRAFRHGAGRVMILDTDAHQGNGTMDIFYGTADVLFISIHQDPRTLYPGRGFVREIGSGDGEGFTVNIPMFPYAGDDLYLEAFNRIVGPVARQFDPDLIIRNGGSDPHFRDLLTTLGMTMAGLRSIGERTASLARSVGAPLVDLVISGYGSHAVPGWLQIWSGATGLDLTIPFEEGEPTLPPRVPEADVRDAVMRTLDDMKETLSPFWDL